MQLVGAVAAAENDAREVDFMLRSPDTMTVAELVGVSKAFGPRVVLEDLSLRLRAGRIHALLGSNGAGKTTTLRMLAGLVAPTTGTVRILGFDAGAERVRDRAAVGLIPSGDRSFYLRLSGRENLLFFGRLQGLSRREAGRRADDLLDQVGLAGAARTRVGLYSHGMQKRLSAARALIVDPALLLVDEATHDLDPDGARRVRDLVAEIAGRGTSVLWATQRLEEIRGFAADVLVLHEGHTVFAGTVPSLVTHTTPRRFLLRVRNGGTPAAVLAERLGRSLAGRAAIDPAGDADGETFLLDLTESTSLGDALRVVLEADVELLACREETPPIESAFLTLVAAEERS
jgi:ABC-type multidrug transport system ATPase subunit